jgi:hypothetical protein
MALARENPGLHSSGFGKEPGLADRYTVILSTVENQEGHGQLAGPPFRIHRPPWYPGPVSPERAQPFDHPLSRKSFLV